MLHFLSSTQLDCCFTGFSVRTFQLTMSRSAFFVPLISFFSFSCPAEFLFPYCFCCISDLYRLHHFKCKNLKCRTFLLNFHPTKLELYQFCLLFTHCSVNGLFSSILYTAHLFLFLTPTIIVYYVYSAYIDHPKNFDFL